MRERYDELGLNMIKIGRRRGIESRSLLDAYYVDKDKSMSERDTSLIKDGLFNMQQSIELIMKGIIKYYGEEYVIGHTTAQNADIIDNLSYEHQELRELNDIYPFLKDLRFSNEMDAIEKRCRYLPYRVIPSIVRDGQQVRDRLIRYVDKQFEEQL